MSPRGLDVAAVQRRVLSERPARQNVNRCRSTLQIYRYRGVSARGHGPTGLLRVRGAARTRRGPRGRPAAIPAPAYRAQERGRRAAARKTRDSRGLGLLFAGDSPRFRICGHTRRAEVTCQHGFAGSTACRAMAFVILFVITSACCPGPRRQIYSLPANVARCPGAIDAGIQRKAPRSCFGHGQRAGYPGCGRPRPFRGPIALAGRALSRLPGYLSPSAAMPVRQLA
jgi:hypothetical protein